MTKKQIDLLTERSIIPFCVIVVLTCCCLLLFSYILDGYPVTKKQIDLLTERSIIPFRVIEMKLDSREVMVRGTVDRVSLNRLYPIHDSSQILAIKLGAYNKAIGAVKAWYEKEHMNWVVVDGRRSKWWVWNRAVDLGKESVEKIQTYLKRTTDGKCIQVHSNHSSFCSLRY